MAQVLDGAIIARLKRVSHAEELSYRPLISALAEPIDILHCDESKATGALSEILGSWAKTYATKGTPSASRVYSVRIGPLAMSGVTLYLFRESTLVAQAKTGEKATFAFPSTACGVANYTVSLLDKLLPVKTPLQDSFRFAVWKVTCNVGNKTDTWCRFVGRSFFVELEREFWSNPLHTIGLAYWISRLPTQTAQVIRFKRVGPYMDGGLTPVERTVYPKFIDYVPVFGDQSVTLEYGVSAYCNTEKGEPTKEECLAARPKTWWSFLVEADNCQTKKTVSADLNVDRHLRLTFTTDNVTGEVVKPRGAET